MLNPAELEEAYRDFSQNLHAWMPEGIIPIDLYVLNELGLFREEVLAPHPLPRREDPLHYFHVLEEQDRVTLYNEQFAIWIAPQAEATQPTTLTYIAWMHGTKPHLEMVLSTQGVYNTPKLILQVLERMLTEVIDTESIIESMGRNSS